VATRRKKFDYPHPVLWKNNDDYDCGHFTIKKTSAEEAEDELRFRFSYDLTSEGLEQLVRENKAKVFLRIECRHTAYRKSFAFDYDEKEIQVVIKAQDVYKSITIKGYVNALENITRFHLPEHNKMYFDNSMSISVDGGGVLAYDDGITVYLDSKEIQKPLSSIISFQRADLDQDTIMPKFDDYSEKIVVFLREDIYEKYYDMQNEPNIPHIKRHLVGITVFPVLVEALSMMKNHEKEASSEEDEDDYKGKLWYRVIKKKIEDKNLSFEDPPVLLANELLGNVILSSMHSIKESFQDAFSGEQTDQMSGGD